jgi:molybdate transport system substrate-binding protein
MHRFLAVCASLVVCALPLVAQDTVTVFAAASTTNAIRDLAKAYETTTSVKVITSFAAASTLAKQIENGAPADVFLSADQRWMDYLATAKQINPATRQDLLTNELVIIAPKNKPFAVTVEPGFNFAGAFAGRLAVGDPTNVPAGIYAKEAFTALGWWNALSARLAPTADVRASLRLVESAEVDAGVVYRTDAVSSTKVAIIATIPAKYLKKLVIYPIACTANAAPAAAAFVAFVRGPEGEKVFTDYGFGWAAAGK